MIITAWTQRPCRNCRRTRLHFRVKTKVDWICIGKAKWRVASQACGRKGDTDG